MLFKKIYALIVLACLMGTLFMGCGGESDSAQKPTESTPKALTGGGSNIIYIITPAHSNSFFKTEADAASAKAKALGYKVKVFSHDEDANKQSELFDKAIADKAAAIICDNAGADETIAQVLKAREANIPTFLIDRDINESGVAICQIMANNYQGAKGVAQAFVKAMGNKGNYVELLGKESDTNASVRSGAFHEVIDQHDMKLIDKQTANWEQAEAHSKVETILQNHHDINGIICGNDTMALGAAEAVKNAGLEGKVVIVGFDCSDEATAAIKAGTMTGTVLQQAALIAEMAVEQADTYLKEGKTGKDEKQLVDCIIITKENVDKVNNFIYTP